MESIMDVYQRLLATQQAVTGLAVNCNERILLIKYQDYLIYADAHLVKVTHKKQFLFWQHPQQVASAYVGNYEESYQLIASILQQLQPAIKSPALVAETTY